MIITLAMQSSCAYAVSFKRFSVLIYICTLLESFCLRITTSWDRVYDDDYATEAMEF